MHRILLFKKKARVESLDWRDGQSATHIEKNDGLNCSTDDQCSLSIFGPYITFSAFDYPSRFLATLRELIPDFAGIDEEGKGKNIETN